MGQSQQYEIGFQFPNEVNTIAPFTVRTLKIDNPGGNWLYQPETQQFVGPFTLGSYWALKGDNNTVHVQVKAPTGRASYNSGSFATITALEDAIPTSPGFGIADPTAPLAFNSATFTVTSVNVNQALTFTARSAMVNNPQGRWLFFPDAGAYVPPFTQGVVIAFPTGVTTARVTADATAIPAGQVNPGGGNAATVIFVDGNLSPSGGTQVPIIAQNVTTINVTNVNINQALGYTARSVIVNNPQGRWLYFDDVGAYIPPYTQNATLVFPLGVTTARIHADATAIPAGQFNPGSGNQATTIWTDAILPSNSGSPMPLTNINLASLSQQYSVTTANVNSAIGFTAHSATVDNPGGRWLLIGNQTIPPWSSGAIVNFPIGVTQAVITVITPTGQQNTQAGNATTVTYYDSNLPAAPPVPIGQNLQKAFPYSSMGFNGSVVGPSSASPNLFVPVGTPLNGVTYRFIGAMLSATNKSATAEGAPFSWQVGFGTSGNNLNVTFALGDGDIGSGATATTARTPFVSTAFPLPSDAFPTFTGDGVKVLQFLITSPDSTTNWSVNSILATGLVYAVPVTL